MTTRTLKRLVVLAIAAVSLPAFAHELSCQKELGVVVPAGEGFAFTTAPAVSATIDHYPAQVGFRVRVTNTAPEPSVATGVWDSLSEAHPGAVVLGDAIVGTSIPVGGTLERLVVLPVSSYEACLALGGAPGELACTDGVLENRFVVTHDAGSAECRARLVCMPDTCTAPQWTGERRVEHDQFASGDSVAVATDGRVVFAGAVPGDQTIDAMIATLDRAGALEDLLQWGPTMFSDATAVRIDGQGRRIVAGEYHEPGVGGFGHAFVRSMSPTGELLWEEIFTDLGNTTIPERVSLAVDAASNVYVSYTIERGTLRGVNVVKLSPEGVLLWESAWSLGLPGGAGGVAVTPDGNVFVTGSATGPGLGVIPTHLYVVRLDVTGLPVWYREIASGQRDVARGIAVDEAGNSVIVGYTEGVIDPSFPPPTVPHARSTLALALDPAGNLRWARQLVGDSPVPSGEAVAVALDASGAAWVAGYTWGGLPGTSNPPSSTGYGLVARYDAGGTLLWARQFGERFDFLQGITTDCAGYGIATGLSMTTSELPQAAVVIRLGPDGSD